MDTQNLVKAERCSGMSYSLIQKMFKDIDLACVMGNYFGTTGTGDIKFNDFSRMKSIRKNVSKFGELGMGKGCCMITSTSLLENWRQERLSDLVRYLVGSYQTMIEGIEEKWG